MARERRDGFGQIVDEIKRAARKGMGIYLMAPVEPRERKPIAVRLPSIAPKRCSYCQEYMPHGSARLGRCLACGIPFI